MTCSTGMPLGIRYQMADKECSIIYKNYILEVGRFFLYFIDNRYHRLFPDKQLFPMAKQAGPFFLERTIDDVIFYKMDGRYYVRLKPCLPDIRRSPRFRRTMVSAKRMGRASKIASALYAALPKGLKRFDRYRALTGAAFYLLREGKTDKEALALLWARQQDCVESGCAIAAAIYDGLRLSFRQEWMLWAFAEEAMVMLKEGKREAEVLETLRAVYAAEFDRGYREENVFRYREWAKPTRIGSAGATCAEKRRRRLRRERAGNGAPYSEGEVCHASFASPGRHGIPTHIRRKAGVLFSRPLMAGPGFDNNRTLPP